MVKAKNQMSYYVHPERVEIVFSKIERLFFLRKNDDRVQ